MTVFAATTAAARAAALFSRRKTGEKLTPGTNFPRHERASFIPATVKMLNICLPVQSRHPLPSCRGKMMIGYKKKERKKERATDAPVHVAAITHRRVRPPVCASRTQTCWNPAGMDGGRAGRDAGAGGRGSFCVRALPPRTLSCLLLKLKLGTDNRANPPSVPSPRLHARVSCER